jgi:hypothetical protein
MKTLAESDFGFLRAFETCALTPAEMRHRAHLRLACIYLRLYPFEVALETLRTRLQQFLAYHGAPASAYHETITRAWLLAVQHFMQSAEPVADSEEFVAANPRLLDKEIMGSHYTREVLMSEEARVRFIEPNRAPIPREIGDCSGR